MIVRTNVREKLSQLKSEVLEQLTHARNTTVAVRQSDLERLEEVAEDLVVVLDGVDVLSGDMALAAKHLDGANDRDVAVLLDAIHLAGFVVGRVEPLSHINVPRAVANLIRDVRCRRGLVVHRADELDLQC